MSVQHRYIGIVISYDIYKYFTTTNTDEKKNKQAHKQHHFNIGQRFTEICAKCWDMGEGGGSESSETLLHPSPCPSVHHI